MSAARRIFLVGCPRSGTTILQRMLGAHSELATFPETHFFAEVRARNPRLAAVGLASRRARSRARELVEAMGAKELMTAFPRHALTVGTASRAFVSLLDALARREGKSRWVEKTPRHLHFISLITKEVEEPRFVHLVRSGADTALSLFEVARRYPEWGLGDLDACIDRWNRDLRITARMLNRPGHVLVRFEQLVERPEETLRRLAASLELAFEPRMLEGTDDPRLVGDEPWKAGARAPISKPEDRLERVDEATRARLERLLLPLDRTLAEHARAAVA